ncbi:MAG TPA: hypothetical protein H9851_04350 [Candidatus Borkfalkia faecavium]|uniref:Uncharacterized protein n=1 Tax=Candidatus Borkfalkia faecavium TaxID=2838508 RepID=A0A9D1W262_9FIRM|nr:hypothetical protein [Candidatus Borkfalkia faecavium]
MEIDVFPFCKQFLRVRKPRLSVSAPHLPHTCGFCRKGEGAAFLFQTNTQKKEKRRFFLFSLISIRMRVKPRGVL